MKETMNVCACVLALMEIWTSLCIYREDGRKGLIERVVTGKDNEKYPCITSLHVNGKSCYP